MQESILITKQLHFDMAHALDNYDGKCRFIHGHTFHLSVTVQGKVIQREGYPKNGMVMDFGMLKSIIKAEIENEFDHSLVLKDTSPYRIIEQISTERLVLLPYQPTCENLLSDFVCRIKSRLPKGISLHSMRLQETPTSTAEWHHSEMTASISN